MKPEAKKMIGLARAKGKQLPTFEDAPLEMLPAPITALRMRLNDLEHMHASARTPTSRVKIEAKMRRVQRALDAELAEETLFEELEKPSKGPHTFNRTRFVEAYAPPLNRDEVELLYELPYEQPAGLKTPKERALAKRLVVIGLLEQDPTAPKMYRCTDEGDEVVARWARAGWLG